MKYTNFLLGTTLALFGFSASAATIIEDIDAGILNGTDVGVVDTFMAVTDLPNSGEATETEWVNSYLTDATYVVKTEDVVYFDTNTAGVFAFELNSTETDYFLVKNATQTALFQNLVDLNWGVFDTADLPSDMNLGDGFTISHVTEFDTSGRGIPEVPVPPAVWLFGSGLLGLVGVARRKNAV